MDSHNWSPKLIITGGENGENEMNITVTDIKVSIIIKPHDGIETSESFDIHTGILTKEFVDKLNDISVATNFQYKLSMVSISVWNTFNGMFDYIILRNSHNSETMRYFFGSERNIILHVERYYTHGCSYKLDYTFPLLFSRQLAPPLLFPRQLAPPLLFPRHSAPPLLFPRHSAPPLLFPRQLAPPLLFPRPVVSQQRDLSLEEKQREFKLDWKTLESTPWPGFTVEEWLMHHRDMQCKTGNNTQTESQLNDWKPSDDFCYNNCHIIDMYHVGAIFRYRRSPKFKGLHGMILGYTNKKIKVLVLDELPYPLMCSQSELHVTNLSKNIELRVIENVD